jgi:hypothetical protein
VATQLLEGRTKWGLSEDDDGHREYAIEYKILADREDGPFTVRNTPGLPLPGAPWAFGNDIDVVATCKRRCQVNPVQKQDEATDLWRAAFVFSTKPDKRCQDFRFEDPLTEPPRISGSWTRYMTEITKTRFGIPVKSSSHERFRGPQVEFEDGRPTVRVETNVLNLQLDILAIMHQTVNSVPMWGLPIRCVKLSGVSWAQEFYGNCFPYYRRILEFDINPDTFDRDIQDSGTKCLYGRWERPGVWRLLCINGDVPDHKNPAHFIDFKSPDGTPSNVILNGKGLPAGVCVVWDECAAAGGLSGKMLGCPDATGTGAADPDSVLATLTTGGTYTNYFVSAFSNNKGNSLQDEDVWVNVVHSITPSAWTAFQVYTRGRLVTHNSKTWLAVADSRGAEPGSSTGDPDQQRWLELPALASAGTFDWCRNYSLGEYVVEAARPGLLTGTGQTANEFANCDKTKQGLIRVEHYAEMNHFLLGGIPVGL